MASSSCTIECWNESRRSRSSLSRGWIWNEKGMLQEVFISREKQNMNVSAHVWVQFETPLWNATEGLERNLGSQFYPLFTTSPFLNARYEKNLCKWVMLWKICLLSLLLRSLTTAFLRFLSGYDKNRTVTSILLLLPPSQCLNISQNFSFCSFCMKYQKLFFTEIWLLIFHFKKIGEDCQNWKMCS